MRKIQNIQYKKEWIAEQGFLSIKVLELLTSQEINDWLDENLNVQKLYDLNLYLMKKTQNQDYNYLYITEPGRTECDSEIYTYDNIYEWDKAWWLVQLNFFSKENLPYDYKEYKNLELYGIWLRWIEKIDNNEKLIYASLYGLYSYLIEKSIEYIEDKVRQTLSKDEDLIEAITLFYKTKFTPSYNDYITELIKPYSNHIFVTSESDMDIVILGGKEAAQEISFRNFVHIKEKLKKPYKTVEGLISNLHNLIDKEFSG